jgi:phosphorylcholine metabolism protein LicD
MKKNKEKHLETSNQFQSEIKKLRMKVKTIQRARLAGTKNFHLYADLYNAKIKRANYNEITPISDCMASINGFMVMTWENLQYFPDKVRYFELK